MPPHSKFAALKTKKHKMKKVSFTLAAVAALAFAACNGPANNGGVDSAKIKDSIRIADSIQAAQQTPAPVDTTKKDSTGAAAPAAPAAPAAH